ncbi:hypothetical protein ACFFWB_01430 [Flavobacterium procerum]
MSSDFQPTNAEAKNLFVQRCAENAENR